jgi:hypothetical protein
LVLSTSAGFLKLISTGSAVIKKFLKLKVRSQVVDWSYIGTKCPPTYENPEI